MATNLEVRGVLHQSRLVNVEVFAIVGRDTNDVIGQAIRLLAEAAATSEAVTSHQRDSLGAMSSTGDVDGAASL